jgi:ABC-type sugar transport system substrate-binding protein
MNQIEKLDKKTLCHVAVLLGDRSNPFWMGMKNEYELLAPDVGIRVDHYWADPEKDWEAQLRKLLEILELPYDAVIINPISRTNLVPGIRTAAEKGIHIFDVGAKTDQNLVREAGRWYHPVRTVDFYHQGVLGASYIIERLAAAGDSKAAIIEGRNDAAQSIGRSEGAVNTFAQSVSIHLVSREKADFDRLTAALVSKEIIKRAPDISAFFCANDVMALGVADTMRGYPDHGVMIVGVDLTSESREAIKAGSMTATVAFSPRSVAGVVFQAVLQVTNGEERRKGYGVKSTMVSRENVDSYVG